MSLASVILTILMVAFVGGFLLVGGARLAHEQHAHRSLAPAAMMGVEARQHHAKHFDQSSIAAMGEHMASGVVGHAMDKQWVVVDQFFVNDDNQQVEVITLEEDGATAEAAEVDVASDADVVIIEGNGETSDVNNNNNNNNNVNRAGPLLELEQVQNSGDEDVAVSEAEAAGEAEAGSESDARRFRRSHSRRFSAHPHIRITAFGWTMIVLAVCWSLIIFALKVRTIKLALTMRRMLLAQARQSLPLSSRRLLSSSNSSPQSRRPVPLDVKPPTTPAPLRRRDCARCTFVNAAGSVRCAMCDTSLPFAPAPSGVRAPSSDVPEIFVPGSLFPLNNPIN